MTEKEFLELNVFYGLENVNHGYDSETIWHFSADDFKIVMERSEELDLNILGIECWEKEEEKFTKYYEDYKIPKWHRRAFDEMTKNHAPCIYTATFDVPAYFLREFTKD